MMNDAFIFDDFFGRPFPLQSRRMARPTSRTSQRARPATMTFSQQSQSRPFQHPFFQNPFFSTMFDDFDAEPLRYRQPSQPQPQPQYQFQPEDHGDDLDVEYLGSSYSPPSASSAATGRTRESRHSQRRPQPRVEEPQENEEMMEEPPTQPRAQSSSSPLPPKPRYQSQPQPQPQPRFPTPPKPSSQNQRASGPSIQILDELDEKHIPENEPQPVDARGNVGAGVSNLNVSMNSKPKAPSFPEPTFQLRQDADKYVATYHLPGFPPNQVKLEAQIPGEEDGDAGALLCISAERKTEDSEVVPFSSILEIPNGVPPSAISAHYDDAKEVLTVFVPKPKASVAAIDIQRS